MTRYQKHMQHIHNQATASSIEMAVTLLLEDISDFLINSGVKPGCKLIEDIKSFNKYDYDAHSQLKAYGRKSGITGI